MKIKVYNRNKIKVITPPNIVTTINSDEKLLILFFSFKYLVK